MLRVVSLPYFETSKSLCGEMKPRSLGPAQAPPKVGSSVIALSTFVTLASPLVKSAALSPPPSTVSNAPLGNAKSPRLVSIFALIASERKPFWVTKLPCLCRKHPGGVVNIGLAAVWKDEETIDLAPPKTLPLVRAIKAAFDTYAKIALTKGNVFGGAKSIVSSSFQTAANPMFTTPPGCFLHKQGNFVTQKGFLSEAIRAKIDTNLGVFAFPKGAFDTVEGGGDSAALFTK